MNEHELYVELLLGISSPARRGNSGKVGPVHFCLQRYHNWTKERCIKVLDELIESGKLQRDGIGFVVMGQKRAVEVEANRVLRCAYCGRRYKRRRLTVDHVIPRSRGGADNASNKVLACRSCNEHKGCKTPAEWARSILQFDKPKKESMLSRAATRMHVSLLLFLSTIRGVWNA